MKAQRKILADTSVWVEHFRQNDEFLSQLLLDGLVKIHPMVISELALGSLIRRKDTVENLQLLPSAPVATQSEVDRLIEVRKLYARGIGYVDLHLLASALLDSSLLLWTFDKRLQSIAVELGFGFVIE